MRRLLIAAGLFVLSLALVAPADAGHRGHRTGGHHGRHGHHGHHGHTVHHTPYVRPHHVKGGYHAGHHLKYGHKFSHGYYYRGRAHYHWKYAFYSPAYGCKLYYCPYAQSWYYWAPAYNCYYPLSYFRFARP
jgi:hypothetical protein